MARSLRPNTTQVPDVIIDKWMAKLSGAEFKVLIYITRRTFGFQKEGDTISLKQIVAGITKRDGQQLDCGTGLNKDTVCKALASLEERGFINRQRREDETGDLPNFYSLNVDLDVDALDEDKPDGDRATKSSGNSHLPRVGKTDTPGVRKKRLGARGNSDTMPSDNPTQQQADLQKTELQETATTIAADVFSLTLHLLKEAGFDDQAANEIAIHPNADPENVTAQIQWMKTRKVNKNWHGLLRKAIEGRWSEPQLGTPKPNSNGQTKNGGIGLHAESHDDLEHDARMAELKEIYQQIQAAPAAYDTFLAHLENRKSSELEKPIGKDSIVFRRMTESLFASEQKQLELLEELLAQPEGPLLEFQPLLRS